MKQSINASEWNCDSRVVSCSLLLIEAVIRKQFEGFWKKLTARQIVLVFCSHNSPVFRNALVYLRKWFETVSFLLMPTQKMSNQRFAKKENGMKPWKLFVEVCFEDCNWRDKRKVSVTREVEWERSVSCNSLRNLLGRCYFANVTVAAKVFHCL